MRELRTTVMNVIGFHDLAERGGNSPLKQLTFDAYVYAGGVRLADQVLAIVNAMEDDGDDP